MQTNKYRKVKNRGIGFRRKLRRPRDAPKARILPCKQQATQAAHPAGHEAKNEDQSGFGRNWYRLRKCQVNTQSF